MLSTRTGPRAIVRAAAWELMKWRDFDSPWRHSPFDRDRRNRRDDRGESKRSARSPSSAMTRTGWQERSTKSPRPIDEATRLETVRGRDYDALESVLLALCTGDGAGDGRGTAASFRRARARRGDAAARRAACAADELSRRRGRQPRAAAARRVVADRRLSTRTPRSAPGVLDFLDLLLVARDLVRDNAGGARRAAAALHPYFRR